MQNIKNLVTIGRISAVIGVAALAGCSSMMNSSSKDARSEGRVKDDKNITEAVEKKLKSDPMYKFDSVSVNTFDGVVQLNGFVDNQSQAQRAEDLARGVPGVTQVVNGMLLKPTPTGQTLGERLAPLAPTTSPLPNSGTQNY